MVDSVKSVQPANIEWQGKLAEAVHSKSLFSLYLAMHSQPGASPLSFHSNAKQAREFDVTSLNHYRRAPRASSEKAVKCLSHTNRLLQQGDTPGVLLWQSMHPDPLSVVDNPKKLPPDVKSNCSYLTQHLLQHEHSNQIEVDETLLGDIVAASVELVN
ncbi:VC2046/SO_2500 family protein [Alteromonas ponticola]|uniref:VC2046/SO_2500 family protein n=1 Tax=Alteromonas aquimaris TaxID=2998417 RepID=A0ABT3P6V3_9ALTE|nr:VC2046/SO_2500 family protein [Alteromonas aquimaris]MCW8108501.1 VC2046/SO_2500 family protein [Alteromonas aquimaris]